MPEEKVSGKRTYTNTGTRLAASTLNKPVEPPAAHDRGRWPEPAAPPVPQEAVPTQKLALSEIPGSMLNDGITEVEVAATEPDWAMRVARQIVTLTKYEVPRCGNDIYDYTSRVYGCCRPKDHDGPHETLEDRHSNRYGKEIEGKKYAQIAALIRQAGSGRERELADALRIAVKVYRDAGSGNPRGLALTSAWLAEALRLLGGE